MDSHELELEKLQRGLSSILLLLRVAILLMRSKLLPNNVTTEEKATLVGEAANLAPFVVPMPHRDLLQLFILGSDFPPVKNLY